MHNSVYWTYMTTTCMSVDFVNHTKSWEANICLQQVLHGRGVWRNYAHEREIESIVEITLSTARWPIRLA